MLELISPSDTAEATIAAVIWFIFIGHPKITNDAMILPELDPTIPAIVSLTRLASIAQSANNLSNRKAVNIVMLWKADLESIL
jgi:hypothetical protein